MFHSDVLGRMLPVLTLVVPTVMFGLLRYFFSIMVRGVVNQIMHFSHRHEQEKQVRYHFIQYPLYRRLGRPQVQSGWVQKISPSLELDPQTIQPIASCYTDYAIPAHDLLGCGIVSLRDLCPVF